MLPFPGLDIFEELRFILELLIANTMLMSMSVAIRSRGRIMLAGGYILLTTVSVLYVALPFSSDVAMPNGLLKNILHLVWYITLNFLVMLLMHLSFHANWDLTLALGLIGYAIQHIEYVLINEVLAIGLFPAIKDHLILYSLLSILSTLVVYAIFYAVFKKLLKSMHGLFLESSNQAHLIFIAVNIILMTTAFIGQGIFRNIANPGKYIYSAAVMDIVSCILIIMLMYAFFRIGILYHNNIVTEQLMHEKEKQYILSKETIDLINHKTHDLKHQINALKYMSEQERNIFFNEYKQTINTYESLAHTGNDALDTILSEKLMYCENHNIDLSYIADGHALNFMNVVDIYTVIGNLMDNAIECVSKYPENNRHISMNISVKNNLPSILIQNTCTEKIRFYNGLPGTSKKLDGYHGFGLLGVKNIVDQYNGSMDVDILDDMFTVLIVFKK